MAVIHLSRHRMDFDLFGYKERSQSKRKSKF